MEHGMSITRNDAGEIIGWMEGATFGENDHPYQHEMHRYLATLPVLDEEGEPQWEAEIVEIEAINDETALAMLKHHYRIPPEAILEELRTVRRDVPIQEGVTA